MQLSGVVFSVLAAEATGEKSIPDQLGINLVGLLFQAGSFALLLFILWRFAYMPFLKVIDERRSRAQEIVERSEQVKRELNETQSRNRTELEKTRAESQAILEEARSIKDRIVTEAETRAREQAEAIMRKAQEDIRQERETAFAQLRHETADLAIQAATSVIQHELQTNKETQRKLVEDALTAAKTNPNGRNN
jgi:F-type H+-transporting ATPase subunit b